METTIEGLGFGVYSPPLVDRIWLWVYYNKIPIYPIFYLLKGDYTHKYPALSGSCVEQEVYKQIEDLSH